MTITLAIPPASLSPNGRAHWSEKQRLTRQHKQAAYVLTLDALKGGPKPAVSGYSLAYYWRSNKRDDDNAIASAKPYLDGICKALGIDDATISFRKLTHAKDSKKPRLVILLHLAES